MYRYRNRPSDHGHHIKNQYSPRRSILFGAEIRDGCIRRVEELDKSGAPFSLSPTFSREEPGNTQTGYVINYEEICSQNSQKPLRRMLDCKPALIYLVEDMSAEANREPFTGTTENQYTGIYGRWSSRSLKAK